MANRHPAAWRNRDASYDPFVQAAIDAGYRCPLHWTGIETMERAKEIKRGLHRSGRFLKASIGVDLVNASDGTITAVFQRYPREDARAFIKDSGRWNGPR